VVIGVDELDGLGGAGDGFDFVRHGDDVMCLLPHTESNDLPQGVKD